MSSDTPTFERDRINYLKKERISSQKKTFTKWINSFLNKDNLHVNDLFVDLSDGKILIHLLEMISGEKIGPAGRGHLRLHKIESVSRALMFLQKHVQLVGVGAEDIVDGNGMLILGLIWVIILRFQISDISIEDDQGSYETKSAKEALLLWCQRKTKGYRGVDIQNFTTSWKNGLAFNALIHKHRPDLIAFDSLRPNNHDFNLNNAFNVAWDNFNITSLLDAEDVNCARPDDKSIMTYVSSFYHYFAKMKVEETGGRRIAKIVDVMITIDQMKDTYENMVTNLLQWIHLKITELRQDFVRSLPSVQQEMSLFKQFRTVEKPLKNTERLNIEIHLFAINTKIQANKQQRYQIPNGKLVSDVNHAWEMMEKDEHAREMALRCELMRQERLRVLAEKFYKKASLRESWLNDMLHVLCQEEKMDDIANAEKALKRHEAIIHDINTRGERVKIVLMMVDELRNEKYHRIDLIEKRERALKTKWKKLKEKVNERHQKLLELAKLVGLFRNMEDIKGELMDLQVPLESKDYGCHLQDVDILIEKHSLIETELSAQTTKVEKIEEQYKLLEHSNLFGRNILNEYHISLKQLLQKICVLSSERSRMLKESRDLHVFYEEIAEEEMFIKEKERESSSKEVGKDLVSLTRFLKKHQDLECSISNRKEILDVVLCKAHTMIGQNHFASTEIITKITSLRCGVNHLLELVSIRGDRLRDAQQSLQYYSDANDAESWIKEKMFLVRSEDLGHDEQTAKSLLQRHMYVHDEIIAFCNDIRLLEEQSCLMNEPNEKQGNTPNSGEELWEEKEIETEEVVEETVEKQEIKEIVKEVKIPQAKVLYSYSGDGINVVKAEVVYVLSKSNKEWWNVRRQTSRESGYVPANYVQEIEARIIKKIVKEHVMVPEIIKVKKKVMKKVKVEKKLPSQHLSRNKSKKRRDVKRHFTAHFDRDNAATRQLTLANAYRKLLELSEIRCENLKYSQKYFCFCYECNELESWMNRKENWLKNDVLNSDEQYHKIKSQLETFEGELTINESCLTKIRSLVDEISFSERNDIEEIRERQMFLEKRWNDLQIITKHKMKAHEEKHGLKLFEDSCNEIKSWIKEKDYFINEHVVQGSDLESVRNSQRKHQDFERELAANEVKLENVKKQAENLVQHHPGQAKQIKYQEKETQSLLDTLKQRSRERRQLLDVFYGQQGFLADTNDLLNWIYEKQRLFELKDEMKDIQAIQKAIDQKQAIWDDILSYEDRYNQLISYGKSLLQQNSQAIQILERISLMKKEYTNLHDIWQKQTTRLKQDLDFVMFVRDAERINAISASQKLYLTNSELGRSLDEVETLLRKHNGFEKTLEAQEERIIMFQKTANDLVTVNHYDKESIETRKQETIMKRNEVKELTKTRKHQLLQSRILHEFLWNFNEFMSWVEEKLHLARHASYHELTHVDKLILKHQEFQAEIFANESEYTRLIDDGQKLISQKHYGHEEITKGIQKVDKKWQELLSTLREKSLRLKQASEQRILLQTLEDEKLWLNDIDTLLSSSSLGDSLADVTFLIRKQQEKENEIRSHRKTLQSIEAKVLLMLNEGYLEVDRINETFVQFSEKFAEVEELCIIRRSQLDDSLIFHKIIRDIEEELSTIQQYQHTVTSKDLGSNYIDVQKLQKRQQAFEHEIGNLLNRIDDIFGRGQELIDSGHFACDEIEELCDILTASWETLLHECTKRREILADSAESHRYFSEANEADSWMNEKAGLASNQDCGKDEKSVQKLMTKHNALITDIHSYASVINELEKEAKRLIERKHCHLTKIQARQLDIEEQYSGLITMVKMRERKLREASKLYEFLREATEFSDWINEQIRTASCEDCGQNLDQLQEKQEEFNDLQEAVSLNNDIYTRIDKFAKTLVAEGHTETVIIKDEQDILRAMWRQLQDQLSLRRERLLHANEIHQFTNDLEEVLDRLQEKDQQLSFDDLGKDVGSVETLQRKHEVFEHELKPIEKDVMELMKESERIQQNYDGKMVSVIPEQKEIISKTWRELQEKSQSRKKKLDDCLKLHLLNNSIRDLTNWCLDIAQSMDTDEFADDITSAELLLSQHGERKMEIEAREEKFGNIINNGQEMIESGHSASDEISEKLQLLLSERDKLHDLWTQCQSHFDEMYELAVFMKEAKQIEMVLTTQELVLTSGELGSSSHEVEILLKKHENIEKLVMTQEDKLETLVELFENLNNHDHFAAEIIQEKMTLLTERYVNLQRLVEQRRGMLEDSQRLMIFYQDVVELRSWMTEKLQTASDESYKDQRNIDSKIKKHLTFLAELQVHNDIIDDVKRQGDVLITSEHYASDDVRHHLESLEKQWENLVNVSKLKQQRLQETRDIVNFNQEAENIELFIKDKEQVTSSQETADDFEQCSLLNKKYEEFSKELQIGSEKLKKFNEMATKLISTITVEEHDVSKRQRVVNERWERLKELVSERKKKLEDVLEVFTFEKSCDELSSSINEKGILASVEDYSKDLSTVDSLLRKQDELERSVIVLNDAFEILKQEGEALKNKNCSQKHIVDKKITEMMDNFARVNELVVQRQTMLEENKSLLMFLTEFEDISYWLQDLILKLNYEDLDNLNEVEKAIKVNNDQNVMIEGREGQFQQCLELGHQLISNEHFAASEIAKDVEKVQEMWTDMRNKWKLKHGFIKQSYELQRYILDVKQFEKWMQEKESVILNDDLGESIEAVDELIKNHSLIMTSLNAHEQQLSQLLRTSEGLLEHDEVRKERRILKERWKALLEIADNKRKKLEESKLLQQFLEEAHEVTLWMKAKSQVMIDISNSNLKQNLQKQKTFEAELSANQKRVEKVLLHGRSLVQNNHYASCSVEERITHIQNSWDNINIVCEEQRVKLEQAVKKRTFDWFIRDFQEWMSNVEKSLESKDLGHDLNSVEILLRKQSDLETDIHSHEERVQDISSKVDEFIDNDYCQKDEIQKTAEQVISRFHNLSEELVSRTALLRQASIFHQFLRDIEEQKCWIREKQRVVSSDEVARDLSSAESMVKKHEVLMNEVDNHEQIIIKIEKNGQHLTEQQRHYASEEITRNIILLKHQWDELLKSLNKRKRLLVDSLNAQKFYSEISEAECWIEEKLSLVLTEHYGHCQENTEQLLRVNDTLQLNIEHFKTKIDELRLVSEQLVDNGHYDSVMVVERQKSVQMKYENLNEQVKIRHQRLEECIAWYKFDGEARELRECMVDKYNMVHSSDNGNDLEHAQLLLSKCEDFARDLVTFEHRMIAFKEMGQGLVNSDHTKTKITEETLDELYQDWGQLKTQTRLRLKYLEESCDMFKFKDNIDDLKTWITEKEGMLVYTEDHKKDYKTVQKFLRKHEELEGDVDALKSKVNDIKTEGEALSTQIPTESNNIEDLLKHLQEMFHNLIVTVATRREQLMKSLKSQQFLNECKSMSAWINNITSQMTSQDINYVISCDEMLKKHQEYKAEMDAMLQKFVALQQTSESFEKDQTISKKIEELETSWEDLLDFWKLRQEELLKQKSDEDLNREVCELEEWLMAHENKLQLNDGNGTSLENVEDLLKKQDELERLLLAQEERFVNLKMPFSCNNNNTLIHDTTDEYCSLIEPDDDIEQDAADSLQMFPTTFSQKNSQTKNNSNSTTVDEKQIEKHDLDGDDGQCSFDQYDIPRINTVISNNASENGNNDIVDEEELLKTIHEDIEDNELGIEVQESDKDIQNDRESSEKDPMFLSEPVHHGFLQRKQETNNKKEKVFGEQWTTYYTVLTNEQLQFYKDINGVKLRNETCASLDLTKASCEEVLNSLRDVFRVQLSDNSVFHFSCDDAENKRIWIGKIEQVIEILNYRKDDQEDEIIDELLIETGDKNDTKYDELQYNNKQQAPMIIITDANDKIGDVYSSETNSDADISDDEALPEFFEHFKDDDDLIEMLSDLSGPESPPLPPPDFPPPDFPPPDFPPPPLMIQHTTSYTNDEPRALPQTSSITKENMEHTTYTLSTTDNETSFPPPPLFNEANNEATISMTDNEPATTPLSSPSTIEDHVISPPHDEYITNMLDFIPPPLLDGTFDFLDEPSSQEQLEVEEIFREAVNVVDISDLDITTEVTDPPLRRTMPPPPPLRRTMPPPPPSPTMSLLSDIDLDILAKKEEKKEEKKGFFGGIFKRKK